TGAAGTTPFSFESHSSVVRVRKVGSSASVSADRLRARVLGSGKRGSSERPARPIASQSASQNFWVMHMMKIQPSLVGKVWTGASERCALRGWRDETSPSLRYQTPG